MQQWAWRLNAVTAISGWEGCALFRFHQYPVVLFSIEAQRVVHRLCITGTSSLSFCPPLLYCYSVEPSREGLQLPLPRQLLQRRRQKPGGPSHHRHEQDRQQVRRETLNQAVSPQCYCSAGWGCVELARTAVGCEGVELLLMWLVSGMCWWLQSQYLPCR